jgi:hypothetical protein
LYPAAVGHFHRFALLLRRAHPLPVQHRPVPRTQVRNEIEIFAFVESEPQMALADVDVWEDDGVVAFPSQGATFAGHYVQRSHSDLLVLRLLDYDSHARRPFSRHICGKNTPSSVTYLSLLP